jgi:hypothetical protein
MSAREAEGFGFSSVELSFREKKPTSLTAMIDRTITLNMAATLARSDIIEFCLL